MSVCLRRPLTGVSLFVSAAVATASPVVLDTEQKAAAGMATAFWTGQVTPPVFNGRLDTIREYADHTLKTVAAATTAAGLMSTPGGIAIGCSISGTVEARMADVQPRVLRVRWRDCVAPVLGFTRTLNGPMAITLPADTFQPQNALAIRFGNAGGEFSYRIRVDTAEQIDEITEAFDVVLRGDISMTRLGDCCEWVGTSSFVMNGYVDNRSLVQSPPGSPPAFHGFKMTADGLSVVRSTNAVASMQEDDVLFERGHLTFDTAQPFGTWAEGWRFRDFHVRKIIDFTAPNEQLSVDGRVEVTWSDRAAPGCLDGLYAFRTRAPLITDFTTGSLVSGKLGVNGSVVASFYSAANAPPSLPAPVNGMLLNMRVRDVGTFDYDVPSWVQVSNTVGQCHP